MLSGVVRANTSLLRLDLSDNALCGLGDKEGGGGGAGGGGAGGGKAAASDTFGNYCGRGLEALGRAVRLAKQLNTLILAGNQVASHPAPLGETSKSHWFKVI